MTKHENNTVDQQLCQLCATDHMHNTLMVEGVAECYYRVATRQDVEVAAGMRVMDGRNTTSKILKNTIEDHQPYFLFAETQQGECDREIDDMLEVCKIQENSVDVLYGISISR